MTNDDQTCVSYQLSALTNSTIWSGPVFIQWNKKELRPKIKQIFILLCFT